MFMKKRTAVNSSLSSNLGVIVAAGVLTVAMATVGLARSWARTAEAGAASDTGNVLGIEFDGRQVSDLDKSVQFYEALGFQLSDKPSSWKVDKVVNQLGGTKGAMSRTATLTIQSSVSTKPFTLVLREYKGIDRKNWGDLSTSDLGSGHIDLTVQDDVAPVADKLKAINMFRAVNMGIGGGGPMHTFGFVQDPDGMYVEMIAKRAQPAAPPPPPPASTSAPAEAPVDRVGKQPGFNHIGLNILDAEKALSFYQGFLGGDYPPLKPDVATPAGGQPRMNMLNGWFPQATTDGKMRLELLPFPQDKGKVPPPERFSDIAVNYVGFQVSDLDTLYGRLKAAGIETVSEGGIVKVKDGRAVVVRDPDVGGFVELFQPTKKS
jgi:catechol 2,3-dioxygenase-like lactoylglutathione lyase family enzyme